MKIVILCGGKGQRMQSGQNHPKSMSWVNGKPLINHIMKTYAKYGFNDFILPLGYKGDMIRDYFLNYELNNCNIMKETVTNKTTILGNCDNFKVTMVNTGLETMTGARIKRVSQYIDGDVFMVTYGDGLADVDINKLIAFHKAKGKIGTLTGIKKKSQYGILEVQNDIALSFKEKNTTEGVINGGYFVFNIAFLDYLDSKESCVLEEEPIKKLIKDKELAVYMHDGLWLSVDTPKDLEYANQVWKEG